MAPNLPVAPIFAAGKEPLPPGFTEEDRTQMMQAKKMEQWMAFGMESCVAKTVLAGGGGMFVSSSGISVLE
jgi:import inner membrane translocase subunit TIM22